MTLRPATADDVETLIALTLAFYAEDGFATGEPAIRTNWSALLGLDSVRAMVAEREGEIVGFAVTTSHVGLESGLVAELEDLYVRPDARRRGIAAQLITDSADWARDRGCTVLDVCIAPNGRDAGHLFDFYRARGFHDDGRRLVHLDLG